MILLLPSCTVVSNDRVFPKLAWYWSAEAKRQRESDAYRKSFQTNDSTVFPSK